MQGKYIRISHYETDVNDLIDGDIVAGSLRIFITYPLTHPLDTTYVRGWNAPAKPLTKRELAEFICDTYQDIYTEEKEYWIGLNTTGVGCDIEGDPIPAPKYGINGPDVSDLQLISAQHIDDKWVVSVGVIDGN